MTKNMGTIDRSLRGLVGLLALPGAFVFGWFTGWMVWVAAGVGLVMLLTAGVGTCPAYSLIGVKTCKTA
jgi:hypothetical protein